MKHLAPFLIFLLVSACSTPPKPPEPYGFRVPINQSRENAPADKKPVVVTESASSPISN